MPKNGSKGRSPFLVIQTEIYRVGGAHQPAILRRDVTAAPANAA